MWLVVEKAHTKYIRSYGIFKKMKVYTMVTGNIFAVGFHVVFFGMTAVVKYGGTLELQLSSSSVKPSR